jgi:transmembrane sensor
MENDDHIWKLVARKFAGEASENELFLLQQILIERPDIKHAVQIISKLCKQGEIKSEVDYQLYMAFAKHVHKMMEGLKRS